MDTFVLLGAICGDMAGSVYEWHNIKYRLKPWALMGPKSRFTDDSVMTVAVAVGLKNGLTRLGKTTGFTPEDGPILLEELKNAVYRYGNRYPDAGYGRSFFRWLRSPEKEPYGSWGNGSAMRASYPGWLAHSLEEAEFLADASARITHDHPEGINGAKAVAGSIYLLRAARGQGTEEAKAAVQQYAARYYDMNFTLDEIRPDYEFDVSCRGSVPQAIRAFLEGEDYADTLSLAISIGGDSDTIAAIAGSLAAAWYPIPEELQAAALARLTPELRSALEDAADFLPEREN